MTRSSSADDASGEELHDLLTECIARAEREGDAGVEAFLAEHPRHAEALRPRLAALRCSGLFHPPRRNLCADEGRTLGDFLLLRKLGEGGMGVVYLAEQRSLRRRVALKVVRPGQLLFEGARVRFQREVEAVARLQHPGIVPVHVVGEADGVPYFAMEHVPGCTLACALRALRGREPRTLRGRDLAEAIARCAPEAAGASPHAASGFAFEGSWTDACFRVVEQAADALDHAHRRGVLHRDVKPSNLMITPAGRVMLLDFGLAATGGDRITGTGAQLGSLPYLSPEQVRGDSSALDARTDVYGLGVTLYECLTLALPYAEETLAATMQRILEGKTRSARAMNSTVPWDAETVCLTAMERDPARRYASAADLARDARNVLEQRPIDARRPSLAYRLLRGAQRHPARALAIALGALVVVGGPVGFGLVEHEARVDLKAAFLRSEGMRLAAVAERLLATDGTLALLLAIEGAERHPGAEANNALLAALHGCREIRAIDAHVGGVHRVRFSPDGSLVATAGGDCDIRLWDGATGEARGELIGHELEVTSIEFSPDGRRLVSASEDSTARIWDVAGARTLAVLRGHRGALASARLDARGDLVVTASADGTARLWNASTGSLVRALVGHEKGVTDARFDPTGGRVATASADGTVRIWDTASGVEIGRQTHGDAILSIRFDARGERLLTASRDGEARLVAVATGERLLDLPGNGEPLVAAELDPRGEHVIAAAQDLRTRQWDASTGALLAERRDHDRAVNGVAWSPDGRQVLTWSADDTARIVDRDFRSQIAMLACGIRPVAGAAFRPDGAVLATVGDRLRLWRAASASELARTDLFGVRGRQVTSSSDGRRIGLAGPDGVARVWNAETGVVELEVPSPTRPIYYVAFSADSEWIAVCRKDGTVHVWSRSGAEPVAVLRGHEGVVRWACFTPDASRLVTCGDDRTARVWDWRTGTCVATLEGAKDRLSRIDVSRDGRRAAAAGADHVAHVWSLETGARIGGFAGHEGRLASIHFAEDGHVVTSSYDDSARVWDAETGAQLFVLSQPGVDILDACLSSDGRILVTAAADRTVRLWDARTGAELARDVGYADIVTSVAFDTEGRWITAASSDGRVRRIPVDPLAEARRRKPRRLTVEERVAHEVGDAEELAELREAKQAFDAARKDALWSVEVKERLLADRSLSEGARRRALDLAGELKDAPLLLSRAAWSIVRTPELGEAEYLRALGPAQEAARARPDSGDFRRCLGFAYLRLRRYDDAIEWLERSQASGPDEPPAGRSASLILLALAHRGAGHAPDAVAARADAETLIARDSAASDPFVRSLLAELVAVEGASAR